MAFDGITVAALVAEFSEKLNEGRIYKIAQPETDELLLTIKANKTQYRLLISANASLPLAYFTKNNKPSPMTAPNFCMLLRKHINNGRILSITQPGLERIIDFEIQHLDELGDIKVKHLIVELMGKHSNIIFTDNKNNIIDSIKHITSVMSSIRQVLPGKPYFIPDTQEKLNPLATAKEEFMATVFSKPMSLSRSLFTSYTGISPVIAENICYENKMDSSMPANVLVPGDQNLIWLSFYQLINRIKNGDFVPTIYDKSGKPEEYSALPLSTYPDCQTSTYDNISELLEEYYAKKNLYTRMRQKSVDLRKIVTNALERDRKKYAIQLKQMKDTEKKDKYKVYGELLTVYGYSIKPGTKIFEVENFYTGEMVKITLDGTLSPIDNAKIFFEKYNKLKRTREALTDIVKDTKASIDYLETIMVALDIATSENDLKAINQELIQTGYIKHKRTNNKKEKNLSKPLHFVSSDGFDMFVGKNNLQNEELTFKVATGNDWWFHSKTFPGSHVIVKCNNKELPDSSFEEAAKLAAHFSKGSGQEKVEIDYVQKKHIKKVAGAMPGFVIYHTNYSMAISPDITGIREI